MNEHPPVEPAGTPAESAQFNQLLGALLPPQGSWCDESYVWLTDHSRRLIEFTDGWIEELPMPTDTHQLVMLLIYQLLEKHVGARGGAVRVAPLRMRIREGKFREPDVLLLLDRRDPRRQDRYWLGADLVVEVVSEDDPARDYVEKRADYAEAGIPEYWIADPRDATLTILRLEGDAYVEHGLYRVDQVATPPLLDGLNVDVASVFDTR